MCKKLKAAVIGAGMITNAAHIPAYRNLSEKVELMAVCSHSLSSAQETAARWGIPGVFTDPEEMLRSCQPDLVSICTPNASHKDLSILALEHGANVICEKPVAISLLDAQQMYAAAEKAGRTLVACQTMRFRPEYINAKRLVSQGLLGNVIFGEASRIRRRGVPQWGSFHKKELNGGGAMCDIGVHILDALFWILGQEVEVQAVSGILSNVITKSGDPTTQRDEFDVEDFAAGTIRLKGGVVNFKVAWAANLPDQTAITVMGNKAGLRLPEMDIYSSLARQQADIHLKTIPEERYKNVPFYEHFLLIENVVNYLNGREALVIQPQETIRIAAILDAFYRSAELGREVALEELI